MYLTMVIFPLPFPRKGMETPGTHLNTVLPVFFPLPFPRKGMETPSDK